MSDNEQASIDLSVNADAAVETMKELANAAKEADSNLQQLKQTMAQQVNAAFGAAMGTTVDYSHASNILRGMQPADIAAAVPGVRQVQQQIAERGAQITGAAMDFTSANPQATGQPITQLLDQFRQFMASQQQAQAQQQTQQAQNPPAGGSGGGNDTYYHQSVRSGPLVPPEMQDIARQGYDSAMASRMAALFGRATPALGPQSSGADGSGTDTTQQDRAAGTIGERMAQALTRSAGGMLTGGISGAANAAGVGAAGDLVGGIAKPLMSLLGPLAAPLAAGVAVGGAALGIGDLQAKYATDRQSLAGSIGTQSGATPGSELSTAMHAGWPFDFKEAESAAAARQLGLAGVDSSQIGGGLNASMALARHGGIGLSDATDLTGQLMASGMTAAQVANSYAAMDQAARASGVSVGRLVESLKSMNQAAGVGQISVNGLAAAQAVSDQTGMKIDIARVMSGAIGSTGTTALSQAAMLGLTPAQFEQAQKKPDVLMDSYANLARRYDIGSGGVQIAQQALSSAGFDFSSMSGPQSDQFIRKLVGEGPGAAQKYEQSLVQRENAPGAPGAHTGADYIQAGKVIADAITGPTAKLGIALDEGAAALGNAAGAIDRVLGKYDPRYGANGTDTSAGPNPLHIQPTRPLQGDNTAILAPPSSYDLGIKPIGSGPQAPTPRGFVPNAPGLATAMRQGLQVPNLQGSEQYASPSIVNDIVSAARADKLSPGPLLAQAAQESDFSPTAISKDGGRGLFQFTDPQVGQRYTNQALKELGINADMDWHQAAMNPRIAARMGADYDKDLLAGTHGNWAKAAAQFNAGPHGWDLTNRPGQGQMYGVGVAGNGETVQHQLQITVRTEDQNGRQTGQTRVAHTITGGTGHTSHNIDPSRRVAAAQSYGP